MHDDERADVVSCSETGPRQELSQSSLLASEEREAVVEKHDV